jgi:hypothetical protein
VLAAGEETNCLVTSAAFTAFSLFTPFTCYFPKYRGRCEEGIGRIKAVWGQAGLISKLMWKFESYLLHCLAVFKKTLPLSL